MLTLTIFGVVVFGGAALLGWGVERGLLWLKGRTPRQEARRARAQKREEEPRKWGRKLLESEWLHGVPAIGWGVERGLLWFQGRQEARRALAQERERALREREKALREREKALLELQWWRGVPATGLQVTYRSQSEYDTDLQQMTLMGYVPIEVNRAETGHGFCYEVRYRLRLDGSMSDVPAKPGGRGEAAV